MAMLPSGDPSTYADSDVGSSPRSVGARAGSLTEEPPLAVKWDDASLTRVKLMCSYGGRILPRPHDNQLRYVGGESRIVVVSRNVTLAELIAKLSRMFGASLVVKYQLPYEDLDALISVTSDEDLENMMEEYDRLQSAGNRSASSPRLRVFLFPLKLERSQTSSLIELLETNHTRGCMFVDILNSMPGLSCMRSETSSTISETPDYLLQGNVDALEEWAAATSYGNSRVPLRTEQPAEGKQSDHVASAALFGSLLQHSGLNEVSCAPHSPPPVKAIPVMICSSSSAPPVVISVLSAMVEDALKGQPTPSQQALSETDTSFGALPIRTHLGSGDGSGSIPEQKKHVDSEILLTSDKGMLTSSVGAVEQLLLPSGLMDDDDVNQKPLAKGRFDEVSENQKIIFDARVHHILTEPSKGDSVPDVLGLIGQPIFDEEVRLTPVLRKILKVQQTEEFALSPSMSPSDVLSTSAPDIVAPQGPVSVVATPQLIPDDRSKHQVFPPPSSRAIAQIGREDEVGQQVLPVSSRVAVLKPGGEDGLVQHVSASLAHFLFPLETPPKRAGEDALMRQSPAVNTAKVVITSETQPQLQTGQPPVMSKLPTAPNYLYQFQHSPEQFLEAETTYATQATGIQLPIATQTPSPISGAAAMPSPIPASFKPAKVAPGPTIPPATRPAVSLSGTQPPYVMAPSGGAFQQPVPQLRQVSQPLSVMAANLGPSAVFPSMGEATKVISPTFGNVSPSTVFASMGEAAKGISSTPYQQQAEVAHLHRQVTDFLHSQGVSAAMSPHISTQFTVPNVNVLSAPGVPSCFRALGHPLHQVADSFPLQQSPAICAISDKKMPVPVQRAVPAPSLHPPFVPAVTEYSFFTEQPTAIPHPTTMGCVTGYNTPSNIAIRGVGSSPDTVHFVGANPFVDNFQPVSTYQDALEVPPKDKKQSHQVWS